MATVDELIQDGQTRMQIEQSVPWLTQKPKHFSALVVHLRTPRMLEMLNVCSVGGPPGIALGGQDCHADPKGAFTGDISAEMLADVGCTHVILGHSERRHVHSETDAVVRDKIGGAWRASLGPRPDQPSVEAAQPSSAITGVTRIIPAYSSPSGAKVCRKRSVGSASGPNLARVIGVLGTPCSALRKLKT